MATTNLNELLILLCVALFCGKVYTTEYVPVVFWSSSINHKSVPALQHVGKETFKDIMQTYLKEKPFVVVFNDENLSTEDFTIRDTSRKNVYKSLNNAIHSDVDNKLSYLPSVQSPIHVLTSLVKKPNTPLTASGIRSGASKLPKPAAGQFLFIDLDEANDYEDRPHLLKRHVEFMADLYTELRDQYSNILTIYTARQPSWYVPSSSPSRKGRHLMATGPENEGTEMGWNDTHIMIYLGNAPSIRVAGDVEKPMTGIQFSDSELVDGKIQLTGASSNASFTMVFTAANGYWILNNIDIEESSIKVKDVFAPFGFSYHCSSLNLTNRNLSILFPKIQFQPNFNGNLSLVQFGDAYDCVGFTSAPIWSGLFVTFILALIMTVGLCMMMDIKTMDRFDDPKGKTITVTASE